VAQPQAQEARPPAAPPPATKPPEAKPPELLRLTRNLPGESKPIILHADNITTWSEGGQQIILLKGKVLVEEGVVSVRCQQAVAWVDTDRLRRTRILHVDLFAEGEVRLENGSDAKQGTQALVELNTRGELKVRAHGSKIVSEARSDDPLYQRAQSVRLAAPVVPASGIQRTSHQEPAAVPPVAAPPAAPPPANVPLPPTLQPPMSGSPMSPGAAPGQVAPYPPPSPPTMPPTLPSPPPAPRSERPPAPGPPPTPAQPEQPRAATPGPPRLITVSPRTGAPFQTQTFPLPSGEQAIVVTGGVILVVRNLEKIGIVDIEADRLVFWTRGNVQDMFNKMKEKDSAGHASRELEFYLDGNVEIRETTPPSKNKPGQAITMRADQVYYDVGRNVAVAVRADLEYRQPRLPVPGHLKADELLQLSPNQFKAIRAETFASVLPADPGFRVVVAQATLEHKEVPKKSVFGRQVLDRNTGEPLTEDQLLFHGKSVFFKYDDVPFFFLPRVQGDAADPFGPLESIHVGYNRIFGAQLGVGLNMYDLIGVDPAPGTRWRLLLDYLSDRGPALGTRYEYAGQDLFNVPSRHEGLVNIWGIYDTGNDILGGVRNNVPHTPYRARATWQQQWWNLPEGFSVQNQAAFLSDKNFLEQYFKSEFDSAPNQETFFRLKQQQDNWAWTFMTEPRLRSWVTETEWLPRADGWLLGQSLFERLTYNAHASAGYARLRPTSEEPFPLPPIFLTDIEDDTGRFDLWQDLSLPFYLGPLKLAPYGVVDLTYYTRDLNDEATGRFYGGGGVRGSLPLTRLYPGVENLYLNVNGLNHKVVLSANYYIVHSDRTFTQFPQLDRLDDDATDQARRDITPLQTAYNPQNGFFLANSLVFNPQTYAIRRLIDSRVDTLDSIQVLQLDLRQRLQTKRGYPGMQHIIDWMTLDVSASYFPQAQRDNFGESWAFFEWDYVWNLGDRTSVTSNGWFDPFEHGARYWTIGTQFNRPDRTQFYLGYRQTDPLNSRVAIASVGYIFSPKYALTASANYDFGIQSQMTSLTFTRIGTDLQMSVGVSYNSYVNTWGVIFEVLPNLVAQTGRVGRGLGLSSAMLTQPPR
jgi:hypothetical protein